MPKMKQEESRRRGKETIPPPLELAKLFGVPQIEVSLRLDKPVTENWLRVLALRPDRMDEIRIAELMAIIDHLKAKRVIETFTGRS
jgi:hypothetical protein